MTISVSTIRRYYDQNTSLFLNFSSNKHAQNIHRSLWMDGITSMEDALNASNTLILDEIEAAFPRNAKIADLGCGVGASLFYIYSRLRSIHPGFGLTLSPVQARLAKRKITNRHIFFTEADFSYVPLANESLDVVYSIEAIAHAVDLELYFREAGRLLHQGGRLILIDDCKTPKNLSKNEATWLQAFIDGWYVPGVRTSEEYIAIAGKYGLSPVKNLSLTPFLKLRNLPNLLAGIFLAIGKALPFDHAIIPSMIGSMALQQCLHMGIIDYRFLVFEKQ